MPTFTMRIPDPDYEALQAMSLLTGRPMAELVRDAVSEAITEFAGSAELESRYRAEVKAREDAVERLIKLRDSYHSGVPTDSDGESGDIAP
jgi:predicted DNA-binding protein